MNLRREENDRGRERGRKETERGLRKELSMDGKMKWTRLKVSRERESVDAERVIRLRVLKVCVCASACV